jgi:hypothetical protein
MDIRLLFDFRGISQSEWEDAWLKCIEILDFFPVPLAMSRERRTGKEEYTVLSSRLVMEENTENEYLAFRADYVSMEWGGVFTLYRHIAHYADHPVSDKGLLWHDWEITEEYGNFGHISECDSRSIWHHGTSDAPYSLAVLALGIYLESRFPENCFMHGDSYTEDQTERMRLWLGGILQRPVPVPLCSDSDRLFDRLMPFAPDTGSLVRRFLILNKLSLHESFTFLIEKGYHEALRKELISHLKFYNSPLQWGASDMLLPYLRAVRDVEAVVALVQEVQKEKGHESFSLTDLLKLLIDKGITVKPYDTGSETAREWNKTGEGLTTDIESLNRFFLRMNGLPDKIDYYLSADELLEIFACTEPANGVNFQKIIEEGTKKISENYKKLEEVTESFSEQAVNSNRVAPLSYFTSKAQWIRRYGLPSEEYILREVEKQCFTLYTPKDGSDGSLQMARSLGRNLFLYEQEAGEPFFEASPQEAVNGIVRFASDCFSLRETAWQAIEKEKDPDILLMLLFYACVRDNELHFSNWRKFIFESPELWPEMKKAFLEGKYIPLPDENKKRREKKQGKRI